MLSAEQKLFISGGVLVLLSAEMLLAQLLTCHRPWRAILLILPVNTACTSPYFSYYMDGFEAK
jgi:hypothetical protein